MKDNNILNQIVLFIIIINFTFSNYSKKDTHNTFNYFLAEIIIKINGTGLQRIFSNEYIGGLPNNISINNGEKIIDQNTYEVELDNPFDSIALTWQNDLTDCSKMFFWLFINNRNRFIQF